MPNLAFVSNLVTATLFLLVAWFLYKYSTLFSHIEKFWNHISAGFVFIALGNLIRALSSFGVGAYYYMVALIMGSCLLLFGFYRLYVTHKV